MKLNYAEAKAVRDSLYADMRRKSVALHAFTTEHQGVVPHGPHTSCLGLTPDVIKRMPEYQEAKRASDEAFQLLRRFNAKFVPAFRTEIKAERAAR